MAAQKSLRVRKPRTDRFPILIRLDRKIILLIDKMREHHDLAVTRPEQVRRCLDQFLLGK